MEVFSNDKFILFLLFFIPGFISLKVYSLLVADEKRDFSKDICEVVAYSALNYAAWSWLLLIITRPGFSEHHPVRMLGAICLIVFIMPVLWPIILLQFRRCEFLSKYLIDPVRRPWDYVFGKKESFWVIVHLKDGRRIGGLYSSDSFASSYPAENTIYLEKLWHLDEQGGFLEEVKNTNGAILMSSEISIVEFKN